jgi:SAM-dependent methyltransferase
MPLAADSGVNAGIANFHKYSAAYDLLYRDKDYAGEADYVARTIQGAVPNGRDILELASGTGRHGRLLADRGFQVYGIERSADMVVVAKSAAAAVGGCGRFDCAVGDLRAVALDRHFDAVIALFHVISYQTRDDDLRTTFAVAAKHLKPGGVFLFDVWHGPAVVAQQPQRRVKTVGDGRMEVIRTARPELDSERHTVKVTYDVECRDRSTDQVTRFSEDHLMRYLYPTEIETFAAKSGLRVIASEEFVTGATPATSTWSVGYLLRK